MESVSVIDLSYVSFSTAVLLISKGLVNSKIIAKSFGKPHIRLSS